ncbi:MAG TPA: 3-phosphoshikimate 1-carboxyvinyltransferase [Solirubrobacteraceae bacterium]|jgi:3-phosphoshikimate 1-carboxyvinyltransferase|nr:3-phosphoshikimate 1-carboxyvinyltransferase [Solirubrobacteraceae bacterium]
MSAVARVGPGAPSARWEVRVPGSKSITNRALLLAGVADGQSILRDPLLADDTLAMADVLRTLGATVDEESDAGGSVRWSVGGLGGPPSGDAEVYCGMGATVGRFLVPMLAAGHGYFDIDAHAQLRRRPLGPVLEALRAQGSVISGDAFPLVMEASGLSGGEVDVDGSVSSQFLSGLLMAAPFARADTRLRFDVLVSKPYLDLTLDAMRAFGVDVDVTADAMSVAPGGYVAADFAVEPDASTASYFLGSAAITGTTVRLLGLDRRATSQGDIELVGFLEQMGCTVHDGEALELTGPERLRGVTVNMGNTTDVFMTLACVAAFADSPTTIEDIGHARVKESDRIAACAENLRRLGIDVEEGRDYIRIHPGTPQADTQLPTYEDHRIAMAFALIGARVPVILEEPSVVGKTFPEFFERWPVTGAQVQVGEVASQW